MAHCQVRFTFLPRQWDGGLCLRCRVGAGDTAACQVEGMELCPRGAQQLHEVRQALGVLQSTEMTVVPQGPVFPLFTEQSPFARPESWPQAGCGDSNSFTRLSLLYHHGCLFSFADTLSQQEG